LLHAFPAAHHGEPDLELGNLLPGSRFESLEIDDVAFENGDRLFVRFSGRAL